MANSARPQLGFAQIQELRNAIREFGEHKRQKFGPSGYKLVAYTDTFESQIMYYLASSFDEVRMEPLGFLPLTGMATAQPFFKPLLERLGVHIRSHAVGEYKSVNSAFTEERWPKAQRENLTAMLRSLNQQLVSDIAQSRSKFLSHLTSFAPLDLNVIQERPENLDYSASTETIKDGRPEKTPPSPDQLPESDIAKSADAATNKVSSILSVMTNPEKVSTLMDFGPLSALEAVETGLVDRLSYKREYFRSKAKKPSKDEPERFMPFQFYKVARTGEKLKERELHMKAALPKVTVGLVYLVGSILRGDNQFGATRIAKALTDAARDKNVDAIVFRIDSGGGDVIASETIWEAVQHAQETCKKPVIASFGNVAASGGYYCTAPARKILASPGTITGSIGVASLRPIFTEKLLSTLGVNIEDISFSEGAKNLSPFRDLSAQGLQRFWRTTEMMYEVFKKKVSEGRKMDMKEVENVAGGRVWTGLDASKVGLVDELGGLHRAIQIAAEYGWRSKLNVPETKGVSVPETVDVILYPKPRSFVQRLMEVDSSEDLLQGMRSAIRATFVDLARAIVWLAVEDEVETFHSSLHSDAPKFQFDDIHIK
ncbi:hypothetical protein HK102_012819 [Quaeritorhiza haematococci]|nr:hypothetical protein HK102_012819 [Quaeritorhiza haematococci]